MATHPRLRRKANTAQKRRAARSSQARRRPMPSPQRPSRQVARPPQVEAPPARQRPKRRHVQAPALRQHALRPHPRRTTATIGNRSSVQKTGPRPVFYCVSASRSVCVTGRLSTPRKLHQPASSAKAAPAAMVIKGTQKLIFQSKPNT